MSKGFGLGSFVDMLCEICELNVGSNGIIYSRSLGKERSFHQEFWAKKGIKKDANDSFDSCHKCYEKFQDYFAEELIKGLSQNNLVDIEGVYLAFYCKNDFSSNDYYQKFQSALAENIKNHSKEWKIIEVKILDSYKIIRKYIMLVHQSAKIEYEGELLNDKCFDGKKMFWKHNFPVSNEQWIEIEKKIDSEQKQNNQLSIKNSSIISEIIFASGIIIFLVFLFYLVVVRKKKNKKI